MTIGQVGKGILPALNRVNGACLGLPNWEQWWLLAFSWFSWSDHWAGTNPGQAVWDCSCQLVMADSLREKWDKSRGWRWKEKNSAVVAKKLSTRDRGLLRARETSSAKVWSGVIGKSLGQKPLIVWSGVIGKSLGQKPLIVGSSWKKLKYIT